MTDEEKKTELEMKLSMLVIETCLNSEIAPYDAVHVLAKTLTVWAISSARGGREAEVVLDVVGLIWTIGTDMIEAKREEENDESSVQRNH